MKLRSLMLAVTAVACLPLPQGVAQTLSESKHVRLRGLDSNAPLCAGTATYELEASGNSLRIKNASVRETVLGGPDGKFEKKFLSLIAGNQVPFRAEGNIKTRELRITNEANGCAWQGKF